MRTRTKELVLKGKGLKRKQKQNKNKKTLDLASLQQSGVDGVLKVPRQRNTMKFTGHTESFAQLCCTTYLPENFFFLFPEVSRSLKEAKEITEMHPKLNELN